MLVVCAGHGRHFCTCVQDFRILGGKQASRPKTSLRATSGVENASAQRSPGVLGSQQVTSIHKRHSRTIIAHPIAVFIANTPIAHQAFFLTVGHPRLSNKFFSTTITNVWSRADLVSYRVFYAKHYQIFYLVFAALGTVVVVATGIGVIFHFPFFKDNINVLSNLNRLSHMAPCSVCRRCSCHTPPLFSTKAACQECNSLFCNMLRQLI